MVVSASMSLCRPLFLGLNSILEGRQPSLDITTGIILVGMAVTASVLAIKGYLTAKARDIKIICAVLGILSIFVIGLSIVNNFTLQESSPSFSHNHSQVSSSVHVSTYLLLAFSIILAGAAIYLVPKLQVKHLYISPDKRLELEDKTRATLIGPISAALLLITACIFWNGMVISNKVKTNGQVTDSFIQAVNLLNTTGDDNLTKRMSGINSIQHMTEESDIHQEPVIEMLTYYVRKNAAVNTKVPQGYRLPSDIQAILTIIGNRKTIDNKGDDEYTDFYLNLSGINIAGADLRGANLQKTVLQQTNMYKADLRKADFRDACLWGVNLSKAKLQKANLSEVRMSYSDQHYGANLSDADLRDANLKDADMGGVDLRRANMSGAQMESAYLYDSDLSKANLSNTKMQNVRMTGANLTGADLSGANLENAYLDGVDLRGAIGLTQYEINRAYRDNTTKISPPLILNIISNTRGQRQP